MTANNPSKYYPKAGGQFEPVSTGQFQPVKGGQFKPAEGGQFKPDFASCGRCVCKINLSYRIVSLYDTKTTLWLGL